MRIQPVHAVTCGRQPAHESVFQLLQTSLAANHRSRKNGWPVCPADESEPSLKLGLQPALHSFALLHALHDENGICSTLEDYLKLGALLLSAGVLIKFCALTFFNKLF